MNRSIPTFVLLTSSLCAIVLCCATEPAPEAEKIPITSSSPEAIELYREGQRLADRLRPLEAHELFAQAVDEDPHFALAHLGLSNTSSSTQGFYDHLERAAEEARRATEAERWWIEGQLHGTNGNPAAQLESYRQLVDAYPEDERAHDLIATVYFTIQDFEKVIEHCLAANSINPEFSSPYNNLGYSYLALGRYDQAKQAFESYIKLIPDEPNPYDSHGELLLKMGRHDDSIASYRKALEMDPGFYSAYLGIGYNQIFLGDTGAARATFQQLLDTSDDRSQQSAAYLALASADLVDGDAEGARGRFAAALELSQAADDDMAVAADLRLRGDLEQLLGDIDAAEDFYLRSLEATDRADVSDYVKASVRRNHLYREARMAAARGDLDLARSKAAEFRRAVQVLRDPFEVKRSHQLDAEIAVAEGDFDAALSELAQADDALPIVLYLRALAERGKGNTAASRELAKRLLEFNEPTYGWAAFYQRANELAAAGYS